MERIVLAVVFLSAASCGVLGSRARVLPRMGPLTRPPPRVVPASRGVVSPVTKTSSPAAHAEARHVGQAVATQVPIQTSDVTSAATARIQSEIPTATGLWAAGGIGLTSRQQLFPKRAARTSSVARAATPAALDPQKMSSLFLLKEHFKDELPVFKKKYPDLTEKHEDAYLIRFLIQHKGDVPAAAENLRKVTAWRSGEGLPLVTKAAAAYAQATAGGGWDNGPVLAAAPHSDKISKFASGNFLVLSTKKGDLISLIRAGTINSAGLMDAVSEDEMIEFFMYAREINFLVATNRTDLSGRLCRLLAANDLTGVRSFPDSRFQNALTGASAKAVEFYPGFAGPTVLLNLPFLARTLIGFLLPLFPGAVRDKVKFATFGMDYMVDLTDVLKEPTKSKFLDDFEKVTDS